MGVHTGDSITVATPALTLTDKEYQIMRNGLDRRSCAEDRRGDGRLQRAMGREPRGRALWW